MLSFRQHLPTFDAFWARAIRPAWCFIGFSGVTLAILFSVTDFRYPTEGIANCFGFITVLLCLAVAATSVSWFRIALIVEAIALVFVTILIVPPLESILASAAFPFQDEVLARIDRSIGIDWVSLAFWFRDHSQISKLLNHAYASIGWQPLLLIAALGFTDPERLRRVLSASALTLAITIVAFMFVPALGPYAHYKFSAGDFPNILVPAAWLAPGITDSLRHGAHNVSFAGLVTFPSYHAAAALLFAYGWMGVPLLGIPFVVLNAIMLVSCVPVGSHYVIDVIVGLLLAAAALTASNRYFRNYDKVAALPRWRPMLGTRLLFGRRGALFSSSQPAIVADPLAPGAGPRTDRLSPAVQSS